MSSEGFQKFHPREVRMDRHSSVCACVCVCVCVLKVQQVRGDGGCAETSFPDL